MEVTAKRLPQFPEDRHFDHVDTVVTIDGHRLLTLETHDGGTASAWLFDSSRRPNTRHHGYVMSLAVEREFVTYDRNGVADTPLDLLTCCIGSHCLVFHLPDPKRLKPRCYDRFDPTSLRNFFDHDAVTVVGVNMRYVAEKLERDYGIKIMKWHDLNELAVAAMGREDLDLARYGLDRLARTVLGKRWDVLRDDDVESLDDWYGYGTEDDQYYYELPLCLQKIKAVTVDTYLSLMTGTKLLEMLRSTSTPPPTKDLAAASTSSAKKKKKEKKVGEKKERNGSSGGYKNNKR